MERSIPVEPVEEIESVEAFDRVEENEPVAPVDRSSPLQEIAGGFMEDLTRSAEAQIRANPVAAVLGGAVVGLLLGIVLRRL